MSDNIMDGELHHVLNRGVEKRNIFLKNNDYSRFAQSLYDFNGSESMAAIPFSKRNRSDIRCPTKNIVDILCWVLMPNHPHLLLNEKKGGNAGKFSRKVFGGYTKYFNEQKKRSGVLFQGRSKIIPILEEKHFLFIPFYIHLNPLSLFQSDWKECGIRNVKGAMKFLEEYKWSNYRDIIGVGDKEFAHITNRKLFFETFDTDENGYKEAIEEWLKGDEYREISKVGHAMSDWEE